MFNRKPVEVTRRLAARLGDRLFARPDADARARGWQIVPTYGGLGRRYRDPRIATLARARAHHADSGLAARADR
jgi:hypothetical protein